MLPGILLSANTGQGFQTCLVLVSLGEFHSFGLTTCVTMSFAKNGYLGS